MKFGMLSKVLWNFGGQAIPMVIAIFSIPFLIARLGDDRFGLLSIGWMVVGYLSLFDFGIGRAMTRQIAIKIGLEKHDEIQTVFWTANLAMLGMGGVGAIIGVLAAPLLVTRILNVPQWLQEEAQLALVILSLGVPVTIVSTGLRGVLEAFQEFRLSGSIRFLTGLTTYLVPLAIVPWSSSISIIFAALVGSRAVVAFINFAVCMNVFPPLRQWTTFKMEELRGLLTVGGWMTVSNVVSPVMTTLDRFLLGSLLSVGAITYYATPADVLTKILIFPGAVTGVLFPAFASAVYTSRSRTFSLFHRSWDATFFMIFPMVFAAAMLAEPGLTLWLDAEFADRSSSIVKWLAFGVLANGLAQLPYSLLQSAGNSKSVALIHVFELPLYIAFLYGMVITFGITGAAIAWTARAAVDLVALVFVTWKSLAREQRMFTSLWKTEALFVLCMAFALVVPLNPTATAIVLVLGIACSGIILVSRLLPFVRGFKFATTSAGTGTDVRLHD